MAVKSNPFDEIAKNLRAIAIEATKETAKRAQADIVKEADDYLKKYYSNYSPKVYKRTYRLKRAILPYWSDKTSSNTISIEVGVQYKSSALKGAYRSNSKWHQSGDTWKSVPPGLKMNMTDGIKESFGIPEPGWVLNNYLEGIHPWGQRDGESATSLMENYFNTQLPNRIEQYVKDEVFNAIARRFK